MRTIVCFFILVLCIGISTQAQSAPSIEYFTVDKAELDYPAVEAGTETANFSWQAVGLRDGDRMQMDAWVGGQWGLIGEDFDPIKTDTLVIAHPLDFIRPLYRLAVVDASGIIVTEEILELAYASQTEQPIVAMFLALHPTTVIPMSAFDAPFQIQWQVNNRWFNSNVIFEQILPDGTIVNAEYQRPHWQYAHKADYVQLLYPGDYEDVVLRLRVVNHDDGSTLVQEDLRLAVADTPASAAELIEFRARPEQVNPGGNVIVTWQVINSDVVYIEYLDGNPNGRCAGNLETVFYDLPLSGSLEVPVPEINYGALQFRIFADYYVGGSRHQCHSYREPLGEVFVDMTDYVGQGVKFFRNEPYNVVVGDTVTLSWEVTEGESVTIIQPDTGDVYPLLGQIPVAYETYSNLPLSGTLEVTIPDNPTARAAGGRYFVLYIIEDGMFPNTPDSNVHVSFDRDGDLDCRSFLDIGSSSPINPAIETERTVVWDSCGKEHTVLRLARLEGGYDSPQVTEEFVAIESSGSMAIPLPNASGTFRFELMYEYQGERYYLASRVLTLETQSE